MSAGDRGFTLLETIVALTIVVGSALPLLSLMSAEAVAREEAALRERRLEVAHEMLVQLSLLGRAELDRRLGGRRAGSVVTYVTRPEPDLYRVAVADSAAPAVELLATVLYRPDRSP